MPPLQRPPQVAVARAAGSRYLVTASGVSVGSRVGPAVMLFGGFGLAVAVGVVGVAVGAELESGALVVSSLVVALLAFCATVALQWVAILSGAKGLDRATRQHLAGDSRGVLEACHQPLRFVFRSDLRTRALYLLGLLAESNAHFDEAADLFDRAARMIPALAAFKWQRHARVLMLCHRAVSLVALGRVEEADVAVRQASQLFPERPTGVFDAIADDTAFGALGVAASLQNLEPGRDPRALLTFACAVVLEARGMPREALELLDRERASLFAGLTSRERALVARLEGRARGRLAGTPLRAAGVAPDAVEGADDAWADDVLARRA